MAKVCELTGKRPQVGHLVSHANNKTKRRFLPNLQKVVLKSDTLGQIFTFRASVHAQRSVEHAGGLDAFLLGNAAAKLPEGALALRRRVQKAKAGVAQPASGAQQQ
jgi:large subunit ribosomal protein L28